LGIGVDVGVNVGGIDVTIVRFGGGSATVGIAGAGTQAAKRTGKKNKITALDMRRIVPVKRAR